MRNDDQRLNIKGKKVNELLKEKLSIRGMDIINNNNALYSKLRKMVSIKTMEVCVNTLATLGSLLDTARKKSARLKVISTVAHTIQGRKMVQK